MRLVTVCLCVLAAWLPVASARAQLPAGVALRLLETARTGEVARLSELIRVGADATASLTLIRSAEPIPSCTKSPEPQLEILDEVVAAATKTAGDPPAFNQVAVEARLERALGILKAHHLSALRGPYVLDHIAAIDPGLLMERGTYAYLVAVANGEVEYGTPLVWEYMYGGGRSQVKHLLAGGAEPAPVPAKPDPFWNASEPVQVVNADGSKSALSFSTDAELPIAEAWRLHTGDRDLFRNYGDTVSLSRLEQIVEDDPNLVGVEVFLKRGAPQKAEYEIHELLLPDEWLFKTPTRPQTRAHEMGFPVVVHWDGFASLELTHESYETVPSQYRSLLRKIHETFENPQTHLHLGVPSTAVTPGEVDAIARAIETRAVLHHALQPISFGVPRSGSANGALNTSEHWYTGPISVEHNRWERTHDIELRQWDHREGDYIEDGLNLIAFGSRLAQQPARLVLKPVPYGWGDRSAMNLSGGLRYGGEMLSRNADPAIAGIGDEMQALAKRADAFDFGLPADFRLEVQTFLRDNQVEDLLATEEVWLGEARPLSERLPDLEDAL